MPENSRTLANPDLPPTDQVILDTSGLNCPEPVMMLHQIVRKSQSGQVIQVIATDPSTTREIPKFCLHLGHELLEQQQRNLPDQPQYVFWVKQR